MLNKVKEMGSTIGKKVVDNKEKIAIVAGGVLLGAYGVFVYKNIKGTEKLIVKGVKGTYELSKFRDGWEVLGNEDWAILSNGIIDRESIIDALDHIVL